MALAYYFFRFYISSPLTWALPVQFLSSSQCNFLSMASAVGQRGQPVAIHDHLSVSQSMIVLTIDAEEQGEITEMASPHHIVLFPFMSKGHTIPLIHLSHLLFNRGLIITIFTTPSNSPFIRHSLGRTQATIIDLPFPGDIPQLPAGVESTDQLPSMDLLLPFLEATKLFQSHFEKALQNLQGVICIISDGFLAWTQQSASKFNIPRVAFYGMNNYSMSICQTVIRDRPHKGITSNDQPFSLSSLPWLQITKNDLSYPFNDPDASGPFYDFVKETIEKLSESYGMIVNDFYELEPTYTDYWNCNFKPKAWCVGPLCLAMPCAGIPTKTSIEVQWLDERLSMKRSVLYIAFGTQAKMQSAQLAEIATGLERSGVDFLWVLKSNEVELGDGFEERVAGRGLVIRKWAAQMEILGHKSVRGFMSHCGWNSVMESVCAAVPILAWPMMAEQHLNAKMLVEELGIGLRIGAGHGEGGDGLVRSDDVEKMVRELMVGVKGKVVGEKVKEIGEAARRAMEEGGSSYRTLDLLIDDVCQKR
ncbi:UDP-glycosyltransferase 90A1-like [Magnolia sinica]|uniref:UDP-glycosyltransferase 90A1-like n=1 Tax=Magnolia sinica TaxID=86752 RepID=UPI0026594954|nr:UDP-glycosyltransferase 90A1-like [Magnolia sinica]